MQAVANRQTEVGSVSIQQYLKETSFKNMEHLSPQYIYFSNKESSLQKAGKNIPFLLCTCVSFKFLQFALTKPAPVTQVSANTKVTSSGLDL